MNLLSKYSGYLVGLMILGSLMTAVDAKEKAEKALSRQETSVICDDGKTQKIRVGMRRVTILNFPLAPNKIIPGENSFDFKQIKNDLAIKALKPGARTNFFAYMTERRCAFDVIAVPGRGDDIVYVRDPEDQVFQATFK